MVRQKIEPRGHTTGWEVLPQGKGKALAVVFDTVAADATAVKFPPKKTIAVDVAAAADGVAVIGSGDGLKHPENPDSPRGHHAEVLDLTNPAKPFFRKSLPLPGKLLAVTELDRRGFLAWTEEVGGQGARRHLAVSASDFRDVYAVSRLEDIGQASPAIGGRNVFVAKSTKLHGHRLADSAQFQSLGSAPLDWEPNSLRLLGEDLCAGIHQRLAAVPVETFPNGLRSWNVGLGMGFFRPHYWISPGSSEFGHLIRLPEGAFALPQGDYGVGIFK